MPERRPTPQQRHAMGLIRSGMYAASDIPDIVGINHGFTNEAVFLFRLMDRGWVQMVLTPEGKSVLES